MIHKLIEIRNIGKFNHFAAGTPNWNGILKKVNTIYAENGSGKTTFTQIIKSVYQNNPDLIIKRKSLGSTGDISVKLLDDNNKLIQFSSDKWNNPIDNIEIFDFLFVESNVYLISLGNYDNPGTFFEVVIGDEAVRLFNKIKELIQKRKKYGQRRDNLHKKIKNLSEDDTVLLNKLKQQKENATNAFKKLHIRIGKLEKKLESVAETFGQQYLEKINEYLCLFNTTLQITKLNKKGQNFVYYLRISDYDVRSESDSISLKHTLSEGEKDALAISFFLARLSLKQDLSEYTIIFDDPISSLDYNRRCTILNQLIKFANNSKQFILCSHDLNFVKDFADRFPDSLNLKIVSNSQSSIFIEQDIKQETMTGIFKDLYVLKEFSINGETSGFDKRDVIRRIRPCVEGFFRIKYFGYITDNEWLGDIIKHIQNSNNASDIFYSQKSNLNEISEINEYTKSYHHSSPNYQEQDINTVELQGYCRRTLCLIRKI